MTLREKVKRLRKVEKLSEADKVTIKNVINFILLKNQLNGMMRQSAK